MTYDSWKCTDPNDQYLGVPIDAAWAKFRNGEISLADMGEHLLDAGYDPREVRRWLSKSIHYPIPKGYFGKEE